MIAFSVMPKPTRVSEHSIQHLMKVFRFDRLQALRHLQQRAYLSEKK